MKVYTDTRDATFGELYSIALQNPDVVVLSADTGARIFKEFQRNIPKQFLNVGVSEQNAMSVAAGLALTGKKVFVFGISNFVTLRCYEQIRNDICCMDLPVTVLGMGTGYVYSIDGPTHHITQDISIMRALPGMTIWSPSDYTMVGALVHMAYKSPGPKYIRIDKGPFTPIYDPGKLDFSDGLATVKSGKDLTIVATAIMVTQALKVVEELAIHGVDAGIVDFYRLKPANNRFFLEAVSHSKRIVTLEEHTIAGGLGSIVCEIMADQGTTIPVKRIGIPDNYRLEVGSRAWVQSLDGLDVYGITKTILDWIE